MSAEDFLPSAQPATPVAEPVQGEIVSDPQQLERIRAEHKVVLDPFVAAAKDISVDTAEDAEGATEVLADIARRKKTLEAERKKLAKPVDEAKKAIQTLFNGLKAPLDEARDILEPKVLAWQEREDERVRKANAEAEREQREKHEAEQKRIAEEQAEAQRKADDATADAVAASERMAENGSEESQDAALAAAETAREAQAELAVKREERPAFTLPEREEVESTIDTVRGSATRRKTWTFEVVNAAAVPREYLAVDDKKIRQAVKDGAREIPGVNIFEKSGLAVRA